MGIIGGSVGYKLLSTIRKHYVSSHCSGAAYASQSKVEALFGAQIWGEIAGKTVIDFGCGNGAEAVEFAQRGAARVIGVDIREEAFRTARASATFLQVQDRCTFTTQPKEQADLVFSIDAFEHFADPAEIIGLMSKLVKPGGALLIAFGPPWYHPYGGHLFSVFPWAHLIFTEQALIRWRADFKHDGATRFCEVEGGLNQMTLGRFKQLVRTCNLKFEWMETVPIRQVQRFAPLLPREFFTATLRCKLTR